MAKLTLHKMTNLAPIVLFVYNRPEHTKKTLETLAANELADKSRLIIYSDGPKYNEDIGCVNKVRQIIRKKKWCVEIEIIEAKNNLGLADSVISGLNEVFSTYEKAIILEDDIVTTSGFLKFMNSGLETYNTSTKVAGITCYAYPFKKNSRIPDIYFLPIGSSWGWGTWKRVWKNFQQDSKKLIHEIAKRDRIKEFDFGQHKFYSMLESQADRKLDSWAIRFYASFFLENQYFLYPKHSMITNTGFDGSGTHSRPNDRMYDSFVKQSSFQKVKIELIPNLCQKAMIIKRTSLVVKVVNWMRKFKIK